MRIVSAITTAPRWKLEPIDGDPHNLRRGEPVSYLPQTLQSLKEAGFDEPMICDDPDLTGSWPNLRRAMAGLVERTDQPDDGLCVFQDDIQVACGLKAWIEQSFWPDDFSRIGVVSLYCAKVNLQPQDGWTDLDLLSSYRPYGALCYVFPRWAAQLLLANPPNLAFLTASDTSVATFCRREKLRYMLHSPGFVEHFGVISSIADHRGNLIPERMAGRWISDANEMSIRETVSDAPAA